MPLLSQQAGDLKKNPKAESKQVMLSSKTLWNMVIIFTIRFNPLSANFTKWSIILKQLVGNLPTNCLSVFGHFVGLVLEELSCRLSQNLRGGYHHLTAKG